MRLTEVLLASSLLFASMPAFGANLIQNGGFESTDFTDWTVACTLCNVVSPGFSGYNANSGSYFAALGDADVEFLSQAFADVAGQSYQLSFFVASDGKTPTELTASINSTTLADLVNPAKTGPTSPYPYVEYTFSFTGSGKDTLTFGEEDDNSYLALDDVSVTGPSSTSPVPEPSSLVLLGTGLAGLVGLGRLRTKRGIKD